MTTENRLLPFMSVAVAACIAVGVGASALLVTSHFGGHAPGCGPGNPCENLARSAWGRVPWIGWPVSYIGLAHAVALLVGLLVARFRLPAFILPPFVRWMIRTGAAVSVFYLAVMLVVRRFCPYCFAVHIANLLLLLLVERYRLLEGAHRASVHRQRRRGPVALATGTAFLLVMVGLGALGTRHARAEEARAEAERRASTERIVSRADASTPQPPADPWGTTGFTGRYRRGPESSPIRIVVLTDYQCPDCKRIEAEIETIMAGRKDVSLAVKHFPMCSEDSPGVVCNRLATRNMHPNACRAARAAEAAGILKGEDGFWAMHRWLFARGGAFTEAELTTGIRELGFDPAVFLGVLSSDETLRRIHADIEDGIAVGLHYTPMIFVNGVEFRGWQTPGALPKTVAEVAAKNPAIATAAVDRPPLAREKYIADWRAQPVRTVPARTGGQRDLGAGKGPQVVVFGDYREPFTAEMDRALRDALREGAVFRYSFRHYPIEPACNRDLPAKLRPEAVHPGACRAAQAAEAAAALGGLDAFRKIHDWLMTHVEAPVDAMVNDGAHAAGIDPAALSAAMADPSVAAAISEDTRAARGLGLTSIPFVFIDGRWVPRTMAGEDNMVTAILRSLERPGS